MVHGENFIERILVRIHMHHPPENRWPEAAASRIARILRGNRTF
jgi:hypothetical protein